MTGERLSVEPPRWRSLDLGHLLQLAALLVGAAVAIGDLKTDIAVLNTKVELLTVQLVDLKGELRERDRRQAWRLQGGPGRP